jgi:hypothetical protein
MSGRISRRYWCCGKLQETGCALGPRCNRSNPQMDKMCKVCGCCPISHEQVDPDHFEVRVNLHTQDAVRVMDYPENLREIIGLSLDARGLQEEIDYTLEVRRAYVIKAS